MKKIFTFILCLMMTISLIGCSADKKAVAIVNGQNITLGNYEKELALYKSSMGASPDESYWKTKNEKGQTYEDEFKDTILDIMISSEVIYQQAEKDKVIPADKQVQDQINSFNESTKNNSEYQEQLKKMGINEDFLKFQFTRDLANTNLQKKFEEDTKISETEMKKYYEDNKKSFYTDTVTASHILLKTQDSEGKELSAEKKKEAKKKAEEALAKVKSGEDFAKVAKKYSQDSSASNGGELGTFGRGQMVSEFEKAAFNMKKGEISDIVETEYGYHIIKVTGRIDKQETYNNVKDKIKTTLAGQKYTEYVEKLKKDSKIEQKEDVVKTAKF
ncbi:peptidylprolyl isomerase [Terrisporobacter petrolearius]|uniref:peptidylprolyl isomerase n=1 Tax=Terrisporobacter petrolearius TaxID=1460447 RepID=UPI001D16DD78|nr:peptidylprolyl isomerase [Terrisporobacter petrolearius]MCC3864335.1 peptidylprolyl isomerase [Terrisporobacter petrolearius]